jgi:anti-sigma regulatory factor (Ser/Thr protein kinase)
MSRQVRHQFAATYRAPGAAREAFAADLAAAYPNPPIRAAADGALIVSELVTNAVRAGAQQIDVDYVFNEHDLLICVSDDAPGQPIRREAGFLDTTGRGLQLVEALAQTWRTVPRGAVGKSVHASVALGPAADSPTPQI